MPISRETKLREKGGQIPSKVQLQGALTAPPPPLLRYGHTSGFRFLLPGLWAVPSRLTRNTGLPALKLTNLLNEVLERADHRRINKSHGTFTEPTGGQGPGFQE